MEIRCRNVAEPCWEPLGDLFEEIAVMTLVIICGVGWDGIGYPIPTAIWNGFADLDPISFHIFPAATTYMIGEPSKPNGGNAEFSWVCGCFSVPPRGGRTVIVQATRNRNKLTQSCNALVCVAYLRFFEVWSGKSIFK